MSRTLPSVLARGALSAVSLLGVAGLSVGTANAGAASLPTIDGYHCTVASSVKGATLVGSSGAVVCSLGANQVLIAKGAGTVVLLSVSKNTTFRGSTAAGAHDVMIGSSSGSHFVGGAGSNLIRTGKGANSILAGTARTFVHATGGSSSVTCTSTAPLTVVGSGAKLSHSCARVHVENGAMDLVGTVTAVGTNSLTVQYTEADAAAVAWLAANGNPTVVSFDTSTATIHRDGGGAVQVGDSVNIAANAPTSGTTLVAVDVEAAGVQGSVESDDAAGATNWRGVITAISGSQITVTHKSVDTAAEAWLAANGSPSTVTFDTSTAQVDVHGGGTLAVGDRVEISANPPTSGSLFVALSVEAAPASSTRGPGDATTMEWQGQVTAVTATTVTVTYRDTNDAGQAWLTANGTPTSVTFDITSASIQREGGGSLAVGDVVQIQATAPTSGTTLIASQIEAAPAHGTGDPGGTHQTSLLIQGSVTAVGTTTITVTIQDENGLAASWLSANGNPTSVTFDITSAQIQRHGGGSVQVGDEVLVVATAPTSGTTLVATQIGAAAPRPEPQPGPTGGDTQWLGTVTAVGASTITVTYTQENQAASTWLAANGSPTSIVFDLSGAHVYVAGGSTVAVGDAVVVSAPAPTSGTTFAADLVVATPVSGGPGGGNHGGDHRR